MQHVMTAFIAMAPSRVIRQWVQWARGVRRARGRRVTTVFHVPWMRVTKPLIHVRTWPMTCCATMA